MNLGVRDVLARDAVREFLLTEAGVCRWTASRRGFCVGASFVSMADPHVEQTFGTIHDCEIVEPNS